MKSVKGTDVKVKTMPEQDAVAGLIEIAGWEPEGLCSIVGVDLYNYTKKAQEDLCKEVFPGLKTIGFIPNLVHKPLPKDDKEHNDIASEDFDTLIGDGDWLASAKLNNNISLTVPIADGGYHDAGAKIENVAVRGESPSIAVLNLVRAVLGHPKFESVCQELLKVSKYEISMSLDIIDEIPSKIHKLIPAHQNFVFLPVGIHAPLDKYYMDISSGWASPTAKGFIKKINESGALDDVLTTTRYSLIISREKWDIKDLREVVCIIRTWMDEYYFDEPLIIFRLTENIVVVHGGGYLSKDDS